MERFFKFLVVGLFFFLNANMAFSAFVSPYQSTVKLDKITAPADGISKINFSGTIKNAYGEIIPNVKIEAFSDTDSAKITVDSYTNQLGMFAGTITADKSGIVQLQILANGEKLFDAPEMVFSLLKKAPNENVGAGVGNFASFLKAQLFDDTEIGESVTEFFTIDGVDSIAKTDEKLSVTVTAKDSNGNTDPNYTGTIRFSVPTDPNADLPADYTFTKSDQGVHSFYLALSFDSPGDHQLSVQDLDDVRVSGNFEISVQNSNGNSDNIDTNQPAEISLIVPKNGAILSTSRVNILGNATGCSVVTLMDGDMILGTNIPTSPTGDFTFQTPGLAHGPHNFQAICTDNTSVKSEIISIQIDREGPAVMKVEVAPNPTQPNKTVNAVVGSDEEISGAKFSINGEDVALSRIDSKTFSGTFFAPEIGDYPYSASIFDTFGNEKYENNAGVLQVIDSVEFLTVDLSKKIAEESETVFITLLSQEALTDARAQINGTDIPLEKKTDFEFSGTFLAPSPNKYPIDAFGISAKTGQKIFPQNEVSLTVKEFDFSLNLPDTLLDPNAIIAFDGKAKKDISSIKCDIDGKPINTTTEALNVSGFFTAPSKNLSANISCEIQFLDGDVEKVSETVTASEEFLNAAPTAITNLQAEPGDKRVTLFWSPAKDDIGIKSYKIKFNVCGEPLNQLNVTPDDRTQWYVDGLKNHTKYCFTVTPIDVGDKEGAPSNEAEATPMGTKNTIAKAPTSGANNSWINGLIVFVLGLFFLLIKRRKA